MEKEIEKIIMKRLQILIITDGSNKVGLGHVYRSLNLASSIKKHKHKVQFLTNSIVASDIISKKFPCYLIKKKDLKKTIKIICSINPDIIIIDKLKEDSYFLVSLKREYRKIVAIDYTAKNKHLIPMGINILYPKTGIKTKITKSSLKYAILNPSFSKSTKVKIKKTPKNILVLQGAADTHCLIPKILKSLLPISNEYNIAIVIGAAFDCIKDLDKITKKYNGKIKIYHNIKNMKKIMLKNDIAITGGGMTLLEVCRVGLPSIIICGETFEEETADMIEKLGFGINLGYGVKLSQNTILHKTKALLEDFKLRKKMNANSSDIIDGKGTERVINTLEKW